MELELLVTGKCIIFFLFGGTRGWMEIEGGGD